MRALGAILGLALAAGASSATIAVTVVDGSVSLTGSPSPPSDLILKSTTDNLRFSNSGANEREALTHTAAHTYTYAKDGTSTTTTVTHQGTTTALTALVFATQTSGGSFLALRLVGSDLTGEGGWDKNLNCIQVTYQGSLSIPWYSNAGVAQTDLTRYYQVCDSNAVYVDTDKDMRTGADFAYVTTNPTSDLITTEADYEIVISGVDYVFSSASSATSVTFNQGRFVPSTATNVDNYFLYRVPDGFPAGSFSTVLTTTATDITL